MESKKDIGKLFRENLEQLDFTPSTKVWEQIELDLEKKKKKRRFFIWFFLCTILTTGLLIGLGYTYSDKIPFSNKDVKESNSATEETNKNTKNSLAEEESIGSTDSKIADENTNSKTTKIDTQNNKTILNINSKKNKVASKNNLQNGIKKRWNQNAIVASTAEKKKKEKKYKNNTSVIRNSASNKDFDNSEKSIAETKKTDMTVTKQLDSKQTNITKNNAILDIEKRTSIDSLIASTTDKKINKKPKKEKDSLVVKDSVADVKEEPKEYEIVIAPYYGLNYNGYFGEFNSISNNAILESKGETRSTYGVLLRWMFGNKLGIQVGAGKINNRYFSTIEKNGDGFINTQNVDTDIPIAELNGRFANETKVKFTYESSYIEVPLEAYYVIRDKKMGLATSFGVSLLFSDKNSIFAASENVPKMKIGTLNTNLATSATANAKLYLFYKITPSLQLDLYPSFQYQIMGNTDSSDYSSYFFSVRTGLSYKF